MDKQTTVGFIGLGTMGKPMATNLVKAGYPVVVHSRTREKAESLIAQGVRWAESPAELASLSDVVITMLPDSSDVLEVINGEKGVLKGARAGTVVIDMSTISPEVTRLLADECKKKSVQFLDAPVTGGEAGAISATLSIMVGGPTETLDRVRPVLQCLGSCITHMGGPGAGQTAKLCNQVICGLNILACCEGLTLGIACGLDPNTLLNAIQGGAAGSWMLSNLAPKMLSGDWAPGFRIALQQKDLRLALECASRVKFPLFGTAVTHQVFRVAEAYGYADEGTQALFKALCELAGLEQTAK
ncbi:MAG: NAD(P)-dependent oxidoreductase [Armatimonadota bacterium]